MATLPAGYPEDAFEAFALLKTRDELTVDDLKVLALIELYGECFYQRLAAGVEHAEARALLERNGAEERGHAHRVVKAIRLKSGEAYSLPEGADNPFMKLAPSAVPASAELFGLLEQGEVDGDFAYQAWADHESNAEVADLYRLNGREETRHGERVTEVRRLLGAL
ncbi:MAG: ferritin-like domain-containing protein [Gammaproteobacteria bacterium]|nr:ferritin-like domain-containing protein [Gammaproteobacteria bacterium]MCP5202220.1 ferritin-like domain-containing protein [Gammaproteobacteria bacterium]